MYVRLAALFLLLQVCRTSLLEETVEEFYGYLNRFRKSLIEQCDVSKFPIEKDFELTKFSGEWYEVFRTATMMPVLSSGVWNFQSTKDHDGLEFLFSARFINKKCMPSVQGKVSMSETKPSTMVMSYNSLKGSVIEEYQVMMTDYDHRAVLYACRHVLTSGQCAPDAAFFVLLSKHRSMSQGVMDNLKQMARDYCIQPEILIQQDVLQATCLQDDSFMHQGQDPTENYGWPFCKMTSPCTLSCPICCKEDQSGCVECHCHDDTSEEIQPRRRPDIEAVKKEKTSEKKTEANCVLALTDCPNPNCQLREHSPGCHVCDCPPVMRAPPAILTVGGDVYKIDDVRDCPTTCRTFIQESQLYCNCSNKNYCQPIPPGVPASCPNRAKSDQRYYFDSRTGTCHAFYGSCLGDVNNFAALKDCISTCADVCELNPDPGNCSPSGNVPKYYFNRVRGVCDTFLYGGCGGNANNFDTEEICRHKCPGKMGEQKTVNPVCLQPPEPGNCGESHLRYFYLQVTKTCTRFFYTGCDKNDNHFETEEDCRKLCIDDDHSYPQACPNVIDCPCGISQGPTGCNVCDCQPDGAHGLESSLLLVASVAYLAARWSC